MTATVALLHPSIGKVEGKLSANGIAQFLNLQYATLQDRFAPSELVKYHEHGTINATKLGPQALSHAPGPDFEQQVLLQHTLDYDRSTQYVHELDCLNLNITLPLSTNGNVSSDARLPVFCFVHGGGFNVGSGSFPQYDMSNFVQLSVESGAPVIAISINYRLNAPGFLTSEELRTAGYESNNALRDQRMALEWIRNYITGFGGDPKNITLMGESAGAISVNYHLLSQEPLFRRMMLMSGSVLLLQPIPLEVAEANYQKAIQVLGLESASAEQRIKTLLTMDGTQLCDTLLKAGVPALPVHDNDIVDCMISPTFENVGTAYLEIPGRTWCTGALIGDCQFDGSIQFLRLAHRKKDIAQQIHTSFSQSLGETTANSVLSAYNISPSTPDDEAFHRVLQICNDVQFYAPTLSIASNLSQVMPVYMYRFNEPNPWPGQFQNEAIHIQDLTWLLQNFNEFLPEAQVQQAKTFAKSVIQFVNGKHPWRPTRVADKVAQILGPDGKIEMVRDEAPMNGRRKTIVELATRFGMDVLNEALTAFMNGK